MIALAATAGLIAIEVMLADRLNAQMNPKLAVVAVVGTSLAGAAYCQVHGWLVATPTALGISIWWSVSGVLPVALTAALSMRVAKHRNLPLAAFLAGVTLAYTVAVTLGAALFVKDLSAWPTHLFRALPMALALSVLTVLVCRSPRVGAAASATAPVQPTNAPLPLPDAGGRLLAADVSVIQSAGNYLRLEVAGREMLLRLPLHEAARRLKPHGFIRAHRTALVNTGRISALRREGGRTLLVLDDSRTVAVGRAYVAAIRRSYQGACGSSQPG